jgi:HK97 family phage major capsid protein
MLNKEELENVLKETESLKTKVTEAEEKSKKLEEQLARTSFVPVGNRIDSDEARTLRYFGVPSVKELVRINVADPRFAKVPDDLKYVALEMKKAVDVSRMVAQMFHGAQLDDQRKDESSPVAVKGLLDHNYGRNVLAPKLKAFGSTVSGGGDEWVPTLTSNSYIEEYLLDRVLEQRFKTVNMPSNPYEQPVIAGGTKARKATEGSAMTAANFTTAKLTLSAVKLAQYSEIPEELNEDSAPDILAAARADVIMAQKNAVESAIINGDDDGTHIDSDTQALGADVAEKIWKGLRRQAIANSANGGTSDFSNAIADETKLRVMRTKMGKFGVNVKELAWIVGPSVYNQFMTIDSVKTLDVFGPQATVLTGVVANYQGIPIVISEFMREDLNATGVYDGVTMTRGGVLLVNLTRWFLGNRRPIQVKLVMDLPYQDRWLLASYRRVAYKGFDQTATEKSVVYGYNVAV